MTQTFASKPASTGPLTKKRLDLRSPSKKRAKPPIPQVKWIVGDDFRGAFAECRQLLEIACQPAKGGRPRNFTMPNARVSPVGGSKG